MRSLSRLSLISIVSLSFASLTLACGDDAQPGDATDATDVADSTPDTTREETADTAPAETADTAPAETADTAPAETADTAPEETADTAPAETADTAPEETADTTPGDSGDVTEEEVTPASDQVLYDGTTVTVVDGDGDKIVTLTESIRMPAGGTLDCRGLRLRPLHPVVDPAAPEWSEPEAAIFLPEVVGASVTNCDIADFDFGIFAGGGGEHELTNNQIETRNLGIALMSSNDNLVQDNTIRFGSAGVIAFRKALRNTIKTNTLEHSVLVDTPRLAPGFSFGFARGQGVFVVDGPFSNTSVVYARLGDELFQYPVEVDGVSDTLIEGNTITMLDEVGGRRVGGVFSAVHSKRTTVRGNDISGGPVGIELPGFGDGTGMILPGRCDLDRTRWCRGDAYGDCEIDGIDATSLGACRFEDDGGAPIGRCQISLGVCGGDAECDVEGGEPCEYFVPDEGRMRVMEPVVENNHVHDVRKVGISAYLTSDVVILGNTVERSGIGLAMAAYSVETGIARGNVIRDNDVGLELYLDIGTYFGAKIEANDFVANTVQVDSDGTTYAAIDGNYWGHSSCPGFLASDTSGKIVDCQPYTAPVAAGIIDVLVPCGADNRPHELDGTCAFSAPAVVSGDASGSVTFPVAIGYSGDFSVTGYGLVAPVHHEGTLLPGELVSFALELPAGTKLARIHLDSAEHQHDFDLVVFDGSCEVVGWDTCDALFFGFNIGPEENIDLVPSEATSYFVAVDPYFIAGDEAPYTLDWWVVGDGPSNLTVTAPSEVSAGSSIDVEVSWPTLAPGEWLGVIEHANEHGPLRATVLDVTVP